MSSHSQPQWICSTSNLIHSLGWTDLGEDPDPYVMAAASKAATLFTPEQNSVRGRSDLNPHEVRKPIKNPEGSASGAKATMESSIMDNTIALSACSHAIFTDGKLQLSTIHV